ncbi:MAG: MFS transporter [Phycisphaerae bacterium]|nr:MFS transporter [Phycisphaerae bacterium]
MCTEATSIEYRNLRTLGDNAPFARRNHVLGVTAGTVGNVARDFFHPEMILVGMIYALTGSAVYASLVTVIAKAGMLAPQLLAGSLVEHLPRRRPYFIAATAGRGIAFAGLALTIWLLTRGVTALHLGLFYAAFLAVQICTSLGHVVFMDMIGRLIPAHRVGAFIGMRGFLGGALSLVTGILVIQPILQGVSMPMNYLVLVIIGGVLATVDMAIWCQVRERPGARAERRTRLRDAIRRGVHWLRTHRNYRCYAWARVAFRINYLGVAFFIPYGTERLGYEKTTGGLALLGGVLVAVFKLCSVLGSYLWGRVADRYGSRVTLLRSAQLLLVGVALALLAPAVPQGFSLRVWGLSQAFTLPLTAYLVALGVFGLALRGTMIGGQRFLITSAPPEHRPSYLAFLNTLTSPLTLLPVLAAWIAEAAGMVWVFVFVAAGSILGTVAAARMLPDAPQAAPGRYSQPSQQ